MSAYSVTKWSTVKGTPEDAVAAIETQLETVTDTKTVRLCTIVPTADGKYCALLIYDT